MEPMEISKGLKIEINEVPKTQNALVMRFDGELDSASVKKINESFAQICKLQKSYCIADMSSVGSFSSAALGELMRGRQILIERNGDLVFSGMSLDVRTKFSLIGANKIFRFYSDIRSALNAYKWEIEKNPEQIRLSFPPNLNIVPPVRQFVSRVARQKGYSMRDSFRIETIVDEVCNNAVEHGKQGNEYTIDLVVNIDPEKVEFDVKNLSDPAELESLKSLLKPKEDNENSKPEGKRGRGLALIKMLSDELTVDCSENGTSVHVKKARRE